MKRFSTTFNFLSDFLLSIVLVSIFAFAFFTAVGLSPIGLDQNTVYQTEAVLGLDSDQNSKQIELINLSAPLSLISSNQQESFHEYVVNISELKSNLETAFLKINNHSGTKMLIKIFAEIPVGYKNNMVYGIKINNEAYTFFDSNIANIEKGFELEVENNEEFIINLDLKSYTPISYSQDFKVNLEFINLRELP